MPLLWEKQRHFSYGGAMIASGRFSNRGVGYNPFDKGTRLGVSE